MPMATRNESPEITEPSNVSPPLFRGFRDRVRRARRGPFLAILAILLLAGLIVGGVFWMRWISG